MVTEMLGLCKETQAIRIQTPAEMWSGAGRMENA
jgi:hypothetical protein